MTAVFELIITASLLQTDRLTRTTHTETQTTKIQINFTNNCLGRTGTSMDEFEAPSDKKIQMINSGLITYEVYLPFLFSFARPTSPDMGAIICSVDYLTYQVVITDDAGTDVTLQEPFSFAWDEENHLLTLGTTSQELVGTYTLTIEGRAEFLNFKPMLLVSTQTIVIKTCICELTLPMPDSTTYDMNDPQSLVSVELSGITCEANCNSALDSDIQLSMSVSPAASFLQLVGTQLDWSNAQSTDEGKYTITIAAEINLDDAICSTEASFDFEVIAPIVQEEEPVDEITGPPSFETAPDATYEVNCGGEITLPPVKILSPAVTSTITLIEAPDFIVLSDGKIVIEKEKCEIDTFTVQVELLDDIERF